MEDGGRRITLSEDEVEAMIARGSETGAKRVLTGLGVDIEKPIEVQKDFAWVRERRTSSAALVNAGKFALVASVAGLIVTFCANCWKALVAAAASIGSVPPHH